MRVCFRESPRDEVLWELRAVVLAYQRESGIIIDQYGGTIAQYLGDGLLVYFGFPQAQEDDPQRAVRSALEIVDAVRNLKVPLNGRDSPELAVRVGIHTGAVVIGAVGHGKRLESLALGAVPNTAARIQGAAPIHGVTISDVTYRLVKGYFQTSLPEHHELKGVPGPASLRRVLGRTKARNRQEASGGFGFASLIGRESELGLLQGMWSTCLEGQSQVVLLQGEAGVGKSSLARSMWHETDDLKVWRLEIACSPFYQNTALNPVVTMIKQLLGFHETDTLEERSRKLRLGLSRLSNLDEKVWPLSCYLLGLPCSAADSDALCAETIRQDTLAHLIQSLLAQSRVHPILLVVEDLHWADPTTLELLSKVLERADSNPLMIVLTARPEFAGISGVTKLHLQGLRAASARALVSQLAGKNKISSALLDGLIERSDGIPLFLEELTRAILESEQETHQMIPATLRDSLTARLDRLVEGKPVAQVCSAIGREFSLEILRQLWTGSEQELSGGLQQLEEAELLHRIGFGPQTVCRFRHALIREAAYELMLLESRRVLHRRIAHVLREWPDSQGEEPLAYHYELAGMLGEAIDSHASAANQAREASALLEAEQHLREALKLTDRLTSEQPSNGRLELLMSLAEVQMELYGYASNEVSETYLSVESIQKDTKGANYPFEFCLGLWVWSFVRGDLSRALELASQAEEMAKASAHSRMRLFSCSAQGQTLLYNGQVGRAAAYLREGVELCGRRHDPRNVSSGEDQGLVCWAYLAFALAHQGDVNAATSTSNSSVEAARGLATVHGLAQMLLYSAGLNSLVKQGDLARRRAEEAAELCDANDLQYLRTWADLFATQSLAQSGEAVALSKYEESLFTKMDLGGKAGAPKGSAVLAEGHLAQGQREKALRFVRLGLKWAREQREHLHLPELLRLKALILAEDARAESLYRQSIDEADRMGILLEELRTSVSFAKWLEHRGRSPVAQEVLERACSKLSDVGDYPELQRAREFLKHMKN